MTEQNAFPPAVPLQDGHRMPLLGFGTWQITGDEARQSVLWALEAGYRHLDTATVYGNEREVGAGLAQSGVPRAEVFVTTKLPPSRAGQERQTLEQSLQALGIDQLDLWLIHWPPDSGVLADSWKVMVQAREEGLVRSIGVSNYSLDQIDELTAASGVTPAVNQIEWSPFLFDRDMLEGLRRRDVVLEGYSPFQASHLEDPVLVRIAQAHQVTPAQVIVRWHLQHELVVIPKSVHRERIVANYDVAGFELSEDEMSELDRLGNG